jgi:hypothetical protein
MRLMFLRKAKEYQQKPAFAAHEIKPKLTIGGEFTVARMVLRRNSRDGLEHLRLAFRNPKQNLVDWRSYEPLLQALAQRKSKAAAALSRLWEGSGSTQTRFRAFTDALEEVRIKRRGAQLSITSLLLSALSPTEYPHVLTKDFNAAFERAGLEPFGRERDAAASYAHAISFFDSMIDEGHRVGLILSSRLEARSLAWCIGRRVRLSWYNRQPDSADEPDDLEKTETDRLIKAAARGRAPTKTEMRTLRLSRIGQGQFRYDLLAMWGRCAVTGCRNERLLKASHIKPWKRSTNAERLDPCNGLLLSPSLDAAFDRGLITFAHNGQIRFHSDLAAADRKRLGLNTGMRLSYLTPEHRRYLREHRKLYGFNR